MSDTLALSTDSFPSVAGAPGFFVYVVLAVVFLFFFPVQTPRFPHLNVFQVGNRESLLDIPKSKGISIYEALKDFHDKL